MIGLVMGSASDLGTMRHSAETLEALAVPYEMHVMSAHRTPDAVEAWVTSARQRGLKVLIAAAGGAAHLAGVVAAKTTLPVLAVPMPTPLGGVDSLYSMVQMPGGIPVGTLAIGRAGATNAALLAAQIVALGDPALTERLEAHRADLRQKNQADDQRLQDALNRRQRGAPLAEALTAAGFKLE